MADFTVTIVGGAQVAWVDPAGVSPDRASRIKNDPDHLRSYFSALPIPTSIAVKAIVGGVLAPMDGALGGRLFTAAWVEWSGPAPPPFSSPAGQSSVVNIHPLTTAYSGHHVLRLQRAGGGAWLIPFDMEA